MGVSSVSGSGVGSGEGSGWFSLRSWLSSSELEPCGRVEVSVSESVWECAGVAPGISWSSMQRNFGGEYSGNFPSGPRKGPNPPRSNVIYFFLSRIGGSC